MNACNTLSICHGKFVLKTNSKMLQQFKILLLALIFRGVLSNYEDYSIDSTTSDESCTEPNETGTESNCYCYSQPETEFEYSICAPQKCPPNDACCIGGYNTTSTSIYTAKYQSVNGRCFYIEREAKTFVNSKENCKAKGGKIYEPKNVYELTGIANLAAKLGISGFVWIGIRITYNNNNLNYANYIYDSNNQPSYFYPPWGCHLMGVPNCGKRGTYHTCLRVLTQTTIASILGNVGKVIDSSCNHAKVFSICEL